MMMVTFVLVAIFPGGAPGWPGGSLGYPGWLREITNYPGCDQTGFRHLLKYIRICYGILTLRIQ
jgi:hypothetical protein